MNRFSPFLDLQHTIDCKYRGLDEFRIFFDISNHIIRVRETVGLYEAERSIDNEMVFIRPKFLVRLYLILFILVLNVRLFFGLKILSFLPRFENLKLNLKTHGGLMVSNTGTGILYCFIATRLNELGYFELLKNFLHNDYKDSDLQKFNKDVCRLIDQIESIFSGLRLELLVSQNFHTSTGVILSRALKNTRVKSIELAHCYTQDPFLVTVLPVFADLEVLWTDELSKEISKISPKFRFSYFGYPNLINKKKKEVNSKTSILLLFPGLQAVLPENRTNLIVNFERVLNRLILDYPDFKISIRSHPGDKTPETQKAKFQYHYYFSGKSLRTELEISDLVIGGASSVLVDAFYNGIPALQIVEFDSTEILPSITRLKVIDFLKIDINKLLIKYPYQSVVDSENLALNLLKCTLN